jgi:ferritin-like metal-binding protein YciE
MAEIQAREAKLIQYMNEAYGKEKELETALQAHIQLTTRDAYKKRLKDHLKETKQQAKGLQRRIKQLGGKAEVVPAPGPDVVADAAGAVQSVANKAVAAAKGPLHAVRGTSEPETMLKNAKTEYWNEAEEIANYRAIETLAYAVGDRDTVKLAKQHRRQEERMASFLEKTIDQLTKEVVRTEIPREQRNGGARRSRRGGANKRSAASSGGARAKRSSNSSSRTKGGSASTRAKSNNSPKRARSGSASGRAKSGSSSR